MDARPSTGIAFNMFFLMLQHLLRWQARQGRLTGVTGVTGSRLDLTGRAN